MNVEEFEKQIKETRKQDFPGAYDLANNVFEALDFNDKTISDFQNNASDMILSLRSNCWDLYRNIENEFTSKMLDSLIDDPDFARTIATLSTRDGLKEFAKKYPDHLYNLNLSNTQSRRTRAGKEFEAILEMILLGSGLRLDSQANLGKKAFQDKGLGKLVDIVIPGTLEYEITKAETIILSSKTTLRERWAEVIEETSTTGTSRIYLATIDEEITNDVISRLIQNNITLVVPKNIKINVYNNNPNLLSFEEFIRKCQQKTDYWSLDRYEPDQKEQKLKSTTKQIKKHQKGRGRYKHPIHSFTYDKLHQILDLFSE